MRQYLAALRTLLVLTVVVGLAYPLVMTGVAQAAFHGNANGSLVTRDGKTVGSSLIGQAFTQPVLENGKPKLDADGNPVVEPDPAYFQSRPSAAGLGYDPLSTSASNLGPENEDLDRRDQGAARHCRRTRGGRAVAGPAGRPAGQRFRARPAHQPRVRPSAGRADRARTRPQRAAGSALVDEHIQGRPLGFLGEPRVNVLELNLALDALAAADVSERGRESKVRR